METLKLYGVLTRYFGNERTAKMFVETMESISQQKVDAMEKRLLTKDDKIDLIDRIHKSKIETVMWLISAISVHFFLSVLYSTFFK